MADRIQKLTLAHPVFTPADIKFAEYTPQQEDMSLLANSLARMEERKRTANEKISAMDVAFGEAVAGTNVYVPINLTSILMDLESFKESLVDDKDFEILYHSSW